MTECKECKKEFSPVENYFHTCPDCYGRVRCSECGDSFTPEKDYYHTCPACFSPPEAGRRLTVIGALIDHHFTCPTNDSMASELLASSFEEDQFSHDDEDYY